MHDGCDMRFHPLCGLIGHAQPGATTFREGQKPLRNWVHAFTGPNGACLPQTYCHNHHPVGFEWDAVAGRWRPEYGLQVPTAMFVVLAQ